MSLRNLRATSVLTLFEKGGLSHKAPFMQWRADDRTVNELRESSRKNENFIYYCSVWGAESNGEGPRCMQ